MEKTPEQIAEEIIEAIIEYDAWRDQLHKNDLPMAKATIVRLVKADREAMGREKDTEAGAKTKKMFDVKIQRFLPVVSDDGEADMAVTLKGDYVRVENYEAMGRRVGELERELNSQTYKGNSIGFIYDKMLAYRGQVLPMANALRELGFDYSASGKNNQEREKALMLWATQKSEALNPAPAEKEKP